MHLAVRIKGKYLTLDPDTEIDIEDTNPYFNDVTESFSYPFEVPLDGNRELFGNIDTIESDADVHVTEGDIMTIEVDGIAIRSGKVGNIEDQEIDSEISLQMVSSVYSLDEYLDGVRCRDVPQAERIVIGETIGNIRSSFTYDLNVVVSFFTTQFNKNSQEYEFQTVNKSLSTSTVIGGEELSVSLPALGFSRPDSCDIKDNSGLAGFASNGNLGVEPTVVENYINLSDEYPKKKYCNARICYMHYKKDSNGESSDEVDTTTTDSSEFGKFNPYLVLEANRPASGICFYVLYFLDCLFYMLREHGIVYDNSNLIKVEDFKRLSFFTTHCKYNTERINQSGPGGELPSIDAINKWLKSRNINTILSIPKIKERIEIQRVSVNNKEYNVGDKYIDSDSRVQDLAQSNYHVVEEATITNIWNAVSFPRGGTVGIKADRMRMIANSQNFPDADAKEILDSLWGSFGIKFYLDQQTRVVKPIFIRDIFRNPQDAITIDCVVITARRKVEKITGFRMQYSGQSDKQQREDNITLGVRDYDTTYDYQDYRNLDLSYTYADIITMAYDTNMTCYIDLTTGNRFRVKIDSDAYNDTTAEDESLNKALQSTHPVIFEVGQLTGVEIGDCSKESEDYIQEVSSSFQPIVFNDVNYRYELGDMSEKSFIDNAGNIIQQQTSDSKKQILSAFVSEDMWHENIPRVLMYPLGSQHVSMFLRADITTKESFDISSTDDGDSPLQSADWGLAIAMMRGGGSTSHIDYYDYDYDGYGNSKYRTVAGSDYSLSLDSIDCYSKSYDYNTGDIEGIGDGERFSLKIRSYIEAPRDITGPDGHQYKKGDPLCSPSTAHRGLFDTFFSEYAYFLLHRKVVTITINCEVASLLNIQWDRKYRFGDYVGWINKINTHISAEKGIESVTVELFVL